MRGYTVVAAICDEVAFWRSEDSANPDVEIVAALRPAMATVPEPLLLGISSPYARTRRALGGVPAALRAGQRSRPRVAGRRPGDEPRVDSEGRRRRLCGGPGGGPRRVRRRVPDRHRDVLTARSSRPASSPGSTRGRRGTASGTRPSSIRPAASRTPSRSRSRTRRATTSSSTWSTSGAPRSPPRRRSRSSSGCSSRTACAQVIGDRYSEELVRERFRTHGVAYAVSRGRRATSTSRCCRLTAAHQRGGPGCSMSPRLSAQLL